MSHQILELCHATQVVVNDPDNADAAAESQILALDERCEGTAVHIAGFTVSAVGFVW